MFSSWQIYPLHPIQSLILCSQWGVIVDRVKTLFYIGGRRLAIWILDKNFEWILVLTPIIESIRKPWMEVPISSGIRDITSVRNDDYFINIGKNVC